MNEECARARHARRLMLRRCLRRCAVENARKQTPAHCSARGGADARIAAAAPRAGKKTSKAALSRTCQQMSRYVMQNYGAARINQAGARNPCARKDSAQRASRRQQRAQREPAKAGSSSRQPLPSRCVGERRR